MHPAGCQGGDGAGGLPKRQPQGEHTPSVGTGLLAGRRTGRRVPIAAEDLETRGVGGFWSMQDPQRAQTSLGAVMTQHEDPWGRWLGPTQ